MKRKILTAIMITPLIVFGQLPPVTSINGNVNYNDWNRGGNNGNLTTPNTIGSSSTWNSPFYTITNGTYDLNPYAVFSCYCSPSKSSTLAH